MHTVSFSDSFTQRAPHHTRPRFPRTQDRAVMSRCYDFAADSCCPQRYSSLNKPVPITRTTLPILPKNNGMFDLVVGPLIFRINAYLPPSAILDYYVIRSNLPKPQGTHTTTAWCFLSTPDQTGTHARKGVRGNVPGIKQSRFPCATD